MSNSRLSRIETQWSIVQRAHGSKSGGDLAQAMLIERYAPAIKRYLMASMRNEDAAAEVFQEFALRLVRGDFHRADSDQGKFRNMIKTALYRLMMDYYRNKKRQKQVESSGILENVSVNDDSQPVDDLFTLEWRQSLLDETWNRLEQLQQQTGKSYYSVLRARVDQPKFTTGQLYQSLSDDGISLPAESAFRVFLHRARKRFAAILLQKVAESLDDPSEEQIELELIELGLHHFCKPVLND